MSKDAPSQPTYEHLLAQVVEDFGCHTGTIHRAEGERLILLAHHGVPAELLPIITDIPFGKGIAGAAAASRKPVELCNLQADLEGVAQPQARATAVAGSLAVPVIVAGQVVGVIGIGKAQPYTFSECEKAELTRFGERLFAQAISYSGAKVT